MKVAKMTMKVGLILLLVLNATVALAELPQYVTENFGTVLEGDIQDVEGSWIEVSQESRVQINVMTQEVGFQLVGLPIGHQTFAKGILVCHVGPEASRVDTPGVLIDANGVANFNGTVQLPRGCADAPHDIHFFVRTFAASDTQLGF